MDYKSITLTPGSIIVWKDYNKLEKWWAKLRKKDLEYNKARIMSKETEFITESSNYRFFTLKKPYSKDEAIWCEIYYLTYYMNPFKFYMNPFGLPQAQFIANRIRSNTFSYPTTIESLEKSKYYIERLATDNAIKTKTE